MDAQLNHEQAFELLPWLINGTLHGNELDAVQGHVRDCVTCRLALREQHRLRTAIQAQPTVPLSAEHGYDRLLRELDRARPEQGIGKSRRLFARLLIPTWTRAAFAAISIAAIGTVGWLATTGNVDREAPAFTTLGRKAQSDTGRARDLRVDLIFAESVTEGDMRTLVAEIDGTIVAGPTELGRYTVRLNGHTMQAEQISELIERLGQDPRIRFAGRTLIGE